MDPPHRMEVSMTVSPDKLTTAKSAAGADRAITEALKVGGVPKEALATAVSFVRALAGKGLKPKRGFPNGVPPFIDVVSIETEVASSQFNAILPLLATPGLRGIKVLINGIPDPDVYHLQFDLSIPRE
jgi:hypothetical protein